MADTEPATAAQHTREYHQALLEVWHSGSGFMRHRYRRCGFSGAGNCCCGRPDRSVLHADPGLVTEPPTAAPLYDETRCHAERHIGPAGMKVVVWCDKDTGHKGQHRNEQQGIFWSGNDA